MHKSKRALERFLSKVDFSGPCWLWQAATRKGYGRFVAESRTDGSRRVVEAHVWFYEYFCGPVKETLDHLCRNHACVRPSHLEEVSMQVNILRGIAPAARNARKTHCIRGHPFDEANTGTPAGRNGRVRRRCRTCDRERNRSYYMRKMSTTQRTVRRPWRLESTPSRK